MQDGRIEVPVVNKLKLMKSAETLLLSCENARHFLKLYPQGGSKKSLISWNRARKALIRSLDDVIEGATDGKRTK